jgi:hypothetical protein
MIGFSGHKYTLFTPGNTKAVQIETGSGKPWVSDDK